MVERLEWEEMKRRKEERAEARLTCYNGAM